MNLVASTSSINDHSTDSSSATTAEMIASGAITIRETLATIAPKNTRISTGTTTSVYQTTPTKNNTVDRIHHTTDAKNGRSLHSDANRRTSGRYSKKTPATLTLIFTGSLLG